YCWGRPAYFRPLTWRLSAACRMAVFAVDYRLAPEHPFPAAVEDAAAAWRGLLREAGRDPRRMAIIGDSAGGGLMFATLLSLRDAGDPLPAAAVALSPWTDLAGTGDSLAVNAAADPMFPPSEGAIERTAAVYLNGADPRTPLASPLYGDLRGLPPTLIQVGSTEILLDDSRRMAERLRAAGVPVELEVWPSMPHVWHMKADVVPEGRRAIERIGAFVRRHLDPPP
ncbi:MAG TPA: alpha/beta hydrolase, partial [Geminicoccaceae bacterium]|nr:alpha/beta hydrolase [Geminicoccaceae bacterium]